MKASTTDDLHACPDGGRPVQMEASLSREVLPPSPTAATATRHLSSVTGMEGWRGRRRKKKKKLLLLLLMMICDD